ncbi:conserved protein of unknown function [Methanocaldococcus lauensis]|nr:conserved protein of unknown function [Methanocaldococcus lauensis]
MKKIIFAFFFLIFLISEISYALNTPEISIVPEKCLINDSVYVIFQWRTPYPIEDFNVTVYSDAIKFKNSTLHYAGVAEDVKIFYIFKGKAIKPGNHTIIVKMQYFGEGIYIKRTFLKKISILSLTINSNINLSTTTESKTNITVISNATINNIISNNVSNNISNLGNVGLNTLNETKEVININISNKNQMENNSKNTSYVLKNNNSNTNIEYQQQQNDNILLYGILGLILGVLFGFFVIYIIKL